MPPVRIANPDHPGLRRRRLTGLALAALPWPWLTGCASSSTDIGRLEAPPAVLKSSARFQKEYLIAAGDQVEIAVWRVPEASRVVMVRPDGMISLPLVQDILAGGLTPRELAAAVRTALSGRLVNPEVAVIPTQVRPATVYVLGDVKVPGAQPLRSAVTAAQALALAGGTLRSAAERDAALVRLSGDGYLEAIPLAAFATPGFDNQLAPYMRMAAMPLLADDILFVPESGRSQLSRLLTDALLPLQIYLNYKLVASIV